MSDATIAFAPLDACGFAYERHTTTAGVPYAAFRWRTEGLPALTCTLVLHAGAWRLTAHGLGTRPHHADLPLVQAYVDPGGDDVVAVLALRLRPAELDCDGVVDLLVHLAASVEVVVGRRPEPPPLPLLAPVLPLPPGALGHHGDVEVTEPAPGWVQATAANPDLPWSRLTTTPRLLDRLLDWAPVGTLVQRDGTMAARVTALAGPPGVDDPVDQAVDDARLLVATATRFAGKD